MQFTAGRRQLGSQFGKSLADVGNMEIHRVSKSPHCPNEGEIRRRDDAQKQLMDFGRPNPNHQP
jgi:hypothetical protein